MLPLGDVWASGVVWWSYIGLGTGSTSQHSQNEGTRRLEWIIDHVSKQLKMAY